AFQSELNACLESLSFATALIKELRKCMHILRRYGTTISKAGHSRKYPAGAGADVGVGSAGFGLTNENRAAAGCVPGLAVLLRVRTTDLQLSDVGIPHVDLIVRDDAAALQRLR